MTAIDPVAFAQALLRLATSGPEACEQPAIDLLAPLLVAAGFAVETSSFAPGRPSLVARFGSGEQLPLVFSGHLAVTEDDFPHRRGVADMKAGVAGLVSAAVEMVRQGQARRRPRARRARKQSAWAHNISERRATCLVRSAS